MLYLEDYLEMIEHLPQELRDRFTEMRELDLSVHNSVDSLEKKTRTFLMQSKRGELSDEAIEEEFQKIRKDYYKIMEDAEEKVVIATQIHELVERYLKRLDSDLFKFKCELEADNNGITEILEKRSLELDGGAGTMATAVCNLGGSSQKENCFYGLNAAISSMGSNSQAILNGVGAALGVGIPMASTPTAATKENRHRASKPEKRKENATVALQNVVPEKRANLSNNLSVATPPVAVVRPITPGISALLNTSSNSIGTSPGVTYNLQQLGNSATTAIAAAASQAIVATQQMQQGRRTASLKASYEAIHGATGTSPDFWINREVTTPASTPNAEKSKKKKLNMSIGSTIISNLPTVMGNINTSTSSVNLESLAALSTAGTQTANHLGVTGLISNNAHVATAAMPSVATAISTTAGNSLVRGVFTAVAAGNTSSTLSNSSATSTALTPGSNITLNENGMVVEQTADGEWSYDPNEPRYCTCNQVSYGDMVACDNDACPYEWFHYPCVGITQPPKGKWYCPKCTASMRRRGNRKN